jgi:hypothetical protein
MGDIRMNWEVPDWWAFTLLFLGAYRMWRLLALDTVIDRWRRPILRRIPQKLHEGVECPFCFGAWVVAAWWVAWLVWPHATLVIAAPLALSAAVGVFTVRLDPD